MARWGMVLQDVYTGGSQIQKPYNEWTWEVARCCGNPIPLLPGAGFFPLNLAGVLLPQYHLRKTELVSFY